MGMKIAEYSRYNEEEIKRLYEDAGWTAYTDDMNVLRNGFEKSLLVLAAYEEDELLGIIRVVGDGYTIVLIQDILVFKKHQRKGIGSALLKEVLARFKDVRQIQLVTDNTKKTIAFYKSVGFTELTDFGCCGFMK